MIASQTFFRCLLLTSLMIHLLAIFVFPCYIVTQCGYFLSILLFLQFVSTFLLNFKKSISIRYRLHESIAILISIAHGFFSFTISKTLSDNLDDERWQQQRKGFQNLDGPPQYSSEIINCKTQRKVVKKIQKSRPMFLKSMRRQAHC